jgi:hypothetical protein
MRRERKRNKQKYGMVVDSDSVKDIQREQIKRRNEILRRKENQNKGQ